MEQQSKAQTADIPEVVNPETSISLITKAEIDTQIATAKAFPRSLSQFKRELMSMATVDQEIAEACTYALPRGKDQNGKAKIVKGPSVRFAEMVAVCWGNIRTGSRVIHNNGKVVVCQGMVHDLQKNVFHTEEVERRITTKEGRTYSEDMQVVAGRAGCAVAYRNAVFRVVPAALVQDVYEKVQETARGEAHTLPQRRLIRINFFRSKGITDIQIFEALGVKGEDDIDLDKLSDLQGMVSALKNGEVTLDGLFPPPPAGQTKADAAMKEAEAKIARKKPDPAKDAKNLTNQMEVDMGGGQPPA